jgi:anthranilate/para-aminobenzoate synthase component II
MAAKLTCMTKALKMSLLQEESKVLESLVMTPGPRWPRRRCQVVEVVVETRTGGGDMPVDDG